MKLQTTQNLVAAAIASAAIVATASSHAALIISDDGATAPTTDIFLSSTDRNSNTRVSTAAIDVERERGQSFITPDTGDANTQWGLTAITLEAKSVASLDADAAKRGMTLEIYTWGADTQVVDPVSTIYSGSATFPLLDSLDHFTFVLGTTVLLDENANYGFAISWDDATGVNDIRPAVGQDNAAPVGERYTGGILYDAGAGTAIGNQDLTFFLEGTVVPVPEPGSLALLGLGGLCVLRRRRG